MELRERRGKRHKQLLDDLREKERVLGVKGGSTRSHSMKNSLWRSLWTCGKTDHEMNE
jgi:hypothetical protein